MTRDSRAEIPIIKCSTKEITVRAITQIMPKLCNCLLSGCQFISTSDILFPRPRSGQACPIRVFNPVQSEPYIRLPLPAQGQACPHEIEGAVLLAVAPA